MIFNNRVKYSLLIYLIVVMIILVTKPKFIFKKNGEFKPFGIGKHKTVLPFWLIIFVTIVISYYLSNMILLIKV